MKGGGGTGGVVIFSVGRLIGDTVSVSASIRFVLSAGSSVVSDFVVSVDGAMVTGA